MSYLSGKLGNMTDNTERDELAKVLQSAADGTDTIGFWCFGEITGHGKRFAGMILAAGYRRPRTITTDAELEDLPDETIIRDSYGDPIMKDDKGCWHYGEIPVMEVKFPAVVLWAGGADD